jgi:type IV pilus assembly protein PilN
MTSINLLPWREALKKERQQQFFVALGVSVAVMLAIVAAVHLQMSALINAQKSRNTFLETQITRVEKQIQEIDALEKEKRNLLARMNVIQQLQQGRPQVVHVFDELARTLPDGVYLTNVQQRGGSMSIQGFAQSNARVSAYMRNLDASDWFSDPKLSVIQAAGKSNVTDKNSKFTLNVKLENRLQIDEEVPG